MSSVASITSSAQRRYAQYLPQVDRLLRQLQRQLPPSVSLEDLRGEALLALARVLAQKPDGAGPAFAAYVHLRVRGAVMDELRRLDALPRSARTRAREIRQVVGQLEQRLNRAPSDAEIQAELGLGEQAYRRLVRQTQAPDFASLDAPAQPGDEETARTLAETLADAECRPVWSGLEDGEVRAALRAKITALPARQQRVLQLYYHEGQRLAEIAAEFGVTEARICQLHQQALQSLRGALRRWAA